MGLRQWFRRTPAERAAARQVKAFERKYRNLPPEDQLVMLIGILTQKPYLQKRLREAIGVAHRQEHAQGFQERRTSSGLVVPR